jgi:SagB-type dehydrogenase family enzyme
VLLKRRTWRRFANRPVDLKTLSVLLGLTSGIQSWVMSVNDEKVAIKTSPSGGARHAIELYALVLRVRGLRRGLYHYACADHELHLLEPGGNARIVEKYLPTQWWYKPAAAIVFFSAVFPREQWRYSYPRAYRALLLEAGHLCQTFCLTATWLGLAPFCTMALADSRIENDLKLDGITESVLYAAGVGSRPHNVDWESTSIVGARPAVLNRRRAKRFPGRIIMPARNASMIKTGTTAPRSAAAPASSASRSRRRAR